MGSVDNVKITLSSGSVIVKAEISDCAVGESNVHTPAADELAQDIQSIPEIEQAVQVGASLASLGASIVDLSVQVVTDNTAGTTKQPVSSDPMDVQWGHADTSKAAGIDLAFPAAFLAAVWANVLF